MPDFPHYMCLAEKLDFLRKFSNFGGVELANLEIELVKLLGYELLATAERISFLPTMRDWQYSDLLESKEIQAKLQAVDFTIFDEKQVTLVQDLTGFGLEEISLTLEEGAPCIGDWKNTH